MYVGTSRELVGGDGGPGNGLEIWRSADGSDWSAVVATDEPDALLPSGFGFPGNTGAMGLTVFLDRLYVSTVNHDDMAQIWRFDGSAWEEVGPDSSPWKASLRSRPRCGAHGRATCGAWIAAPGGSWRAVSGPWKR